MVEAAEGQAAGDLLIGRVERMLTPQPEGPMAKHPKLPSGPRKSPQNSGILSGGVKGGKQKLDATPSKTKATAAAKRESMSRKGRKEPGAYSGPKVL